MTILCRSISWTAARAALAALLLGVGSLCLWTANDLRGQAPAKSDAPPKAKKPRAEEEEDDPKPPAKRKVIRVEEEDPNAKPVPRPNAPSPPQQPRQEAGKSAHPAIRQLLQDVAVPHDRVLFSRLDLVSRNQQAGKQTEADVKPIPVFLGDNPSKDRKKGVTLEPLNKTAKLGRSAESILSVQPYERIAQEKVRAFLNEHYDELSRQDAKYLSRLQMLGAAEEALSTALRWHESAKETGARKGEEWASIESDLRKQLLDEVMLKQLKLLAEAREWDRVLARTRLVAVTYAGKADRERIAKPVAELLLRALDDGSGGDDKKQAIRKQLHQMEEEFPDNAVFRPIGQALEKRAANLLEKAQELSKDKEDKEHMRQALDLVRQAEEFSPRLTGLHALKLSLSAEHPVLRVGVRGKLPRYLSPAWACTDSELRAVEMLFEGLVKMSPDADGIYQYRPGLAERLPKVAPLGRKFQLPRRALWSDGKPLMSSDVLSTVKLLKDGVGTGRSSAWGQLLEMPVSKSSPYEVMLRLNQGFLDPLALMTFKILPRNLPVDGKEFALRPVCGGPFFLDHKRQTDEQGRACVIFIANPTYGGRPGKRDLPRIQEVRFYSYDDPMRELGPGGTLDLLLDLTAKEIDFLRQKAPPGRLTVPVPARTTPNRRIYFLAVNQHKIPDANVRRALALAINREALLDQFFRGPLQRQVHKALGGPFPAGSWACNPALANRRDKASHDLFDLDAAKALSQKDAVKRLAYSGVLRVKYPEGDAALAEALKALCQQVKDATGITLEPSACDAHQLRDDVEQSQSYDLAYYHYDFPDETYWLWPLLGQSGPANSESRNYLNFSDQDIQSLLQRAMGHRDFAEVRQCLRTVHESFVRGVMPFIPLWQLDPLCAYRNDVLPVGMDAQLVFTNIELWRLQRR